MDIIGYNTSTKVYNATNIQSNQATAIGTTSTVMLYGQAWYVA
jgi:hypothetical protein